MQLFNNGKEYSLIDPLPIMALLAAEELKRVSVDVELPVHEKRSPSHVPFTIPEPCKLIWSPLTVPFISILFCVAVHQG